MRTTGISTESELLEGARESLSALPGLRVRAARRDAVVHQQEIDLDLEVEVKGRRARILVEAKSSGFPRVLREVAWRLERLRSHDGDPPIVPLIAAPAISSGGRELLRRHGLGYWDAGGSLYLELPWAVYYVDRPAPKLPERRLRNLYRGKAAQVLHALLLEPNRPWHVHELAELAEVSPFTVHHVFKNLEEQLWMDKRGQGPQAVRVLTEPGALLEAWAEAHSLREYEFRRFYGWAQTPSDLRGAVATALDETGVEYALTLSSGAALVAPFATGLDRLSVIVPSTIDLDRVARAADLRPVDEGENVVFLVTRERSPLLFRQRIDDTWVASNVQLFLDLSASPRRGKEQAQHLRTERLGY